jgi:type II secretory pathway pseudopilin PulG
MFYRSLVLFKKTPNRLPGNAGFSMVELLVSIGIIVLVLSVVVTNQRSFNSAVLLRGQAYEIALAMREVQLGAISSVSDGTGVFRSVQGVYFNTAEADNQKYRVFRDSATGFDSNNFWDDGEDFGFSGLFDPRFELRRIEYGTNEVNRLSIVFKRPNFDAIFVTNEAGNTLTEQSVDIVIGLRGGETDVCGEDVRTIQITSAGQISVLECTP